MVRRENKILTFENEGLIFGRSLLRGGYVSWGQGKDSASLYKSDGDYGVGQEAVELIHEVLRDEVTPADLVEGIA
jgi:hypothetical protein